jgi:dethiobiotin synthetase
MVLVVGTGTEVGKTWVAARLLGAWRALGLTVAARKPAQSFDPGSGPTDADVLAAATGERPHEVCPAHRWYAVALAPPMAADALGRAAFAVAELVGETRWPAGVDVGLVETAGGVLSPQADDGDAIALATLLGPLAVVLVADAGLGTINAVRHGIAALGRLPWVEGVKGRVPGSWPAPATPAVWVVLNRFDPASDLHRRNLDWLRRRDHLAVGTSSRADLDDLARALAGAPGDG